MTEYAVYNENANVNGTYDNDLMDWFTDEEEAYAAAQALANETGEVAYISEVYNGDFGDCTEVEPE